MSILIKGTNIEDLQRAMLMFSGHEIVELPDHGRLVDVDVMERMFLEATGTSISFNGVPTVIPAERSEE